MNDKESLIFFNLLGLGFRTVLKLKTKFGTLKNVLSASSDSLMNTQGIRKKALESIIKHRDSDILEKELNLANKANCDIITIDDDSYPKQLKTISSPPIVLYIHGELKPEDNNSVSIVGTRTPTRYGKKMAHNIGYNLAQQGVTVISGLAKGLDSQAHNAAIEAKGRTIAVLGSGLLRLYPKENRKLAKKIETSGAVISEFPLETTPYRSNFPIRNRTISGLSLGTVVVEAATKSGTLITAGFALEQGRVVFAVPGNMDQPTSQGANALIKQGAVLLQDTEDIFREIPYLKRTKSATQEQEKIKLSDKEQEIVSILDSNPVHIDEITESATMTAPEVSVLLLTLEMKKVLKQLPGKYYAIYENKSFV